MAEFTKVTILLVAFGLQVVAAYAAISLALATRWLSWIALALAIVLMSLWRGATVYDVVAYRTPVDLGSEMLGLVIASLTIVGIHAASEGQRALERSHRALRRSEDRYRVAVESAMDAIVVLDELNRICYANAVVQSVFGHAPERLLGKPFSLLAPDAHETTPRSAESDAPKCAPDRVRQITGRHASGRELALEVTFGEHVEDGNVRRTGVLRDVTAREQLQQQLRISEERYSLASRGTNDGIWDWDLRRDEIFFSPRWKTMLGLAENSPCSSPSDWFARIHPDDVAKVRKRIAAHLDGCADHFACEYRIFHESGEYRWMLCRGLAVREANGAAHRMAGSQTDITARKMAEERLVHEALHDALTGLPNRVLFLDRLNRCLTNLRKRSAEPCAVLFVDLDRFKNVNDSLGHALGDRLLMEVARRLNGCVRPADTIARLGGDEFAILLEDVESSRVAGDVAERVLGALSEPVKLDDHEMVISASIGIARGSPSYRCADELMRDADAAMYAAKDLGKARYHFFDAPRQKLARTRVALEAELRRAVELDQIDVDFQAIVSLTTGRTAGFEALARWRSSAGAVPPDVFIPIAEEARLIGALELRVMRRALTELARWQQRFHASPPLTMNLNLSGRHLRDPRVLQDLGDALGAAEVAASSVLLELTESWALADDRTTSDLLAELRSLGFRLVIDDFGTGYSSLSYLHRLPVDAVKLDRSFVSEMGNQNERAAIVGAVVALSKQLSLSVVAEGVETTAQVERLRRIGCDLAQGYFFSAPVDAETAGALVQKELEVLDGTVRPDRDSRPRRRRRLVA
jgi:diguanylate cyclase (GGDEF)-like protein/PAS domain S-box-containing protein